MKHSLLLIAALALAACQAPPAAPPAPLAAGPVAPAPPSPEAARAIAIGEEVMRAAWEEMPDRVAALRPPGARYDAWLDLSREAITRRRAREDAWRAELEAIGAAALAANPTAALARDLALTELGHRAATRVCEFERWQVSHLAGNWIITLSTLGQVQPVGTPELRAQLVARWRAVPAWVDQHMDRVREGLASGHLPPETSVRAALETMDRLLALAPEVSPFHGPARRDADPAFARDLAAAVDEAVLPTLRRYRAFVNDEVKPKARTALGVSANPDGAACYSALVRRNTTLDVEPADVDKRGEEALAAIEAQMAELSKAHYGGRPVRAVLEELRTDPKRRYRDREEILDQARKATERATLALPKAFGRLPRSAFVLEPIPAFQEKSTPPHYLAAALDGSRPAAYRVRLYEPQGEARSPGEAIAFHETVPGHHLQLALASESEHLPMAARFAFSPAFGEGWALYAEQVADELGLYSSPDDRMGMLASAAWRAARLVVDTGLHARGWTRQAAIDELLAHTTMSPAMAASEVDRYLAWPGQATAYTMGYLEIVRLRRAAEQALGARFDLRRFHDVVLEQGHVPLALLARHVEAWIERERRAPAR